MLSCLAKLTQPTLMGNKDQTLHDLKVISGQRSLFNEGGDNRSFESTWEKAINERIIYQLSDRPKEYIKTILKEKMGSNGHDLVGDSLMHLLTLSSVIGLKVLKAGRTESGASLKEPGVEMCP